MPPSRPSTPDSDAIPDGFEPALAALGKAVSELESGDLDLDGALAAHDRGTRLLARCRALLDSADARVALLLRGISESGEPETVPLDAPPPPEPEPEPAPRTKPKAARKPKPAAIAPSTEAGPDLSDLPETVAEAEAEAEVRQVPDPDPDETTAPKPRAEVPAPPWLDAGDFPGFGPG